MTIKNHNLSSIASNNDYHVGNDKQRWGSYQQYQATTIIKFESNLVIWLHSCTCLCLTLSLRFSLCLWVHCKTNCCFIAVSIHIQNNVDFLSQKKSQTSPSQPNPTPTPLSLKANLWLWFPLRFRFRLTLLEGHSVLVFTVTLFVGVVAYFCVVR